MPLFGGYKAAKLKPQLKMAVTRFSIASNKKSALMKQQIREIAILLADQPPKEEKARIKAEALIRDDNTVEAYEILQLTCELLSERIHLISHSKECPPDLISSISTLIWASTIVDIPELVIIRQQFRYKFGKEFDDEAMQNVGGVINERVAAKLSVQPPSAYLVQTYLEKIADEHEVQWKPKVALTADTMSEPMVAPVGYSVQVGGGSGLTPSVYGSGGLSASAPPLSPSFSLPPEAPRSSTTMKQQGKQQQSTYVPVLPSPAAPSRIGDIEEEVDIFVPAVQKSAPGSAASTKDKDDRNNNGDGGDDGGLTNNRGRTQSAGEDSKPPADEDGGNESYDDLAARFAMLQK
jgi:hypothetical protein|eukprot:scaffold1468_cov206-Alexandrium_tamarense.AAC.21